MLLAELVDELDPTLLVELLDELDLELDIELVELDETLETLLFEEALELELLEVDEIELDTLETDELRLERLLAVELDPDDSATCLPPDAGVPEHATRSVERKADARYFAAFMNLHRGRLGLAMTISHAAYHIGSIEISFNVADYLHNIFRTGTLA